MPLNPTDVANKQFAIKLRGYAVDEVDVFLEEVEGELARLLRENNDLRQRATADPAAAAVPAASAAPPAAPEPIAPAAMGSTEGQEAALRTLLLAQRTADEAVAEARAEAAQIVETAQAEADALLAGARAEAEQTLGAARSEAEQLRDSSRAEAESALSRAKVDAERTVATARDQATQMEQQATARVHAATGDLEERQRALEGRIEELGAFEREYRTRLRAYLENQLRELVSRTGADDDRGVGVPAAARASAVGTSREAAPGTGRPDGSPSGAPKQPHLEPGGPERVGPFVSEPPTADESSAS